MYWNDTRLNRYCFPSLTYTFLRLYCLRVRMHICLRVHSSCLLACMILTSINNTVHAQKQNQYSRNVRNKVKIKKWVNIESTFQGVSKQDGLNTTIYHNENYIHIGLTQSLKRQKSTQMSSESSGRFCIPHCLQMRSFLCSTIPDFRQNVAKQLAN